jgi:hypothetical protein
MQMATATRCSPTAATASTLADRPHHRQQGQVLTRPARPLTDEPAPSSRATPS